ncbi:hypothetical protein ACQ3I4_00540 [Zafaria sp. Z1313]|uniref:hypothetical protein n=1 Tax=Zafaria sp. Z1313 TaxID=3423202 RepID=UPI003D301ACF
MRSTVPKLAASLALLLALAGCNSPASGGPVGALSVPGSTCIELRGHEEAVFGTVLRTTPGESGVLTGIDLSEASGLVMTGAWLVDLSPEDPAIGSELLPIEEPLDALWDRRRNAVGSTVSGDAINLLVGLRLGDGVEEGTASGLVIEHSSDDVNYRNETPEAIEVVALECK